MPENIPENMMEKLLDAALAHVPFDGWSESTFSAAAADLGISGDEARGFYPSGGVDLAVAYHRRGDALMREGLDALELENLRYSARVAAVVRLRLEVVSDKEVVRRGMALFAMPNRAARGAQLVWGTADAIWNALGDTSDDINWYSKRAILSGVYGSTVLFWLGDTSGDHAATWAFLDRRIEDVMRFEKLKSQVRDNPVLSRLMAVPNAVLKGVKAPSAVRRTDLPGHWPPGFERN